MYNPQLETFLAVVESGSFNKAAERLYISPPAVIKQINLLEKSLDLQLFVRTHRGLRLTKAGQSLYQDAKYIIQYCKDSRLAAVAFQRIFRFLQVFRFRRARMGKCMACVTQVGVLPSIVA